MTRMIERWFPCAEVSENSRSGWGSGNAEVGIMTWFAKRPTAQAKAATICSLLDWPDDVDEQEELKRIVTEAMSGRFAAATELTAAIKRANPDGASTLDPFSGRGMIPLETARLGLTSYAIDYSHVAVLASRLLTEYPCRNWDNEPALPFAAEDPRMLMSVQPRLVADVAAMFDEVRRRHRERMAPFYPTVDGKEPWGCLWAMTIPCTECGRNFPLIGQLELRKPSTRRSRKTKGTFEDRGQSYRIDTDADSGTWSISIHDGPPTSTPTRQVAPGKSRYDSNGRLAVCPFCNHAHDRPTLMRLLDSGKGSDAPLLMGDLDAEVGKRYRPLQDYERDAIVAAVSALNGLAPINAFLSATPDETIPPGNTWTVQATVYGAKTYGDMMNARQTLSFAVLAESIREIGSELHEHGVGVDYVRALTGYAAAALARKIRRATRGSTLQPAWNKVSDLFATESSLNFSFDYFEVGLADGPGSWDSIADRTLAALRDTMPTAAAHATEVSRGSAVELFFRDGSITSVVTDPPYDAMIDYSDASDLFYVWIKRALAYSWPELGMTQNEFGVQEKTEEIIVKKGGTSSNDPRDRGHYDRLISKAFSEARRVVRDNGVVTIVFGHGEPEVWQRLLTAIQDAGLVLTGAWPAKTEQGGRAGFTNIVTTLTMACRPAPPDRPVGRKGAVESAVRTEIKRRFNEWERGGLAPADMLMAAAGPAMEVVGRYTEVLDAAGDPVGIHTFLPLARAAVQEAMAVEVDHHPLETFDARTRFALWWVRLYGRQTQAKSELRWQTLAASLELEAIRDLIPDAGKGVAFTTAAKFKTKTTAESTVIDVVLALAAASGDGIAAMGEVLARSGRSTEDAYLWAAVTFLATRLPDNDPDAVAFTRVLRTRDGITNAADSVVIASDKKAHRQKLDDDQLRLM